MATSGGSILEVIKIVLEILFLFWVFTWTLREGKEATVKLIAEGGNSISEIKKATRKAIHKVKNS